MVEAYRKIISIDGGTTILARPSGDGYERRDLNADWCIIQDYDVGLEGLQNLIKNVQGDPGVTVHEFGENLLDEDDSTDKLPLGMPARYYPS